MRIVIATTAGDPFGEAFSRAYYGAGGGAPALIVAIRDPRSPSALRRLFAALTVLGLRGTARMSLERSASWPECFRSNGSELIAVGDVHSVETLDRIAAIKPDVIVSVGAPVIFKPALLQLASLATLNVHNGRLPAYRGHFATFWEVLHGERSPALSIHQMTARVDNGPVVYTEAFDIGEAQDMVELLRMKKCKGGEALARVLRKAAADSRFPALPMPVAGGARCFPWPSPADLLEFRWPGRLGLAKRAIEVLVAGMALVALAPVMTVVAALVKLEDGGPVLVWERTTGFRGFGVSTPSFRTQDGGRTTRVGRVLRRSRLDKLPRLASVLTGDVRIGS